MSAKKSKSKKLLVNVSDNIKTEESLSNNKPWFNGMKKFSSVKVLPKTKK